MTDDALVDEIVAFWHAEPNKLLDDIAREFLRDKIMPAIEARVRAEVAEEIAAMLESVAEAPPPAYSGRIQPPALTPEANRYVVSALGLAGEIARSFAAGSPEASRGTVRSRLVDAHQKARADAVAEIRAYGEELAKRAWPPPPSAVLAVAHCVKIIEARSAPCPACGDPWIGGPGCTVDQCQSTHAGSSPDTTPPQIKVNLITHWLPFSVAAENHPFTDEQRHALAGHEDHQTAGAWSAFGWRELRCVTCDLVLWSVTTPKLATGGVVQSSHVYLVGEKGLEPLPGRCGICGGLLTAGGCERHHDTTPEGT